MVNIINFTKELQSFNAQFTTVRDTINLSPLLSIKSKFKIDKISQNIFQIKIQLN